MAFGAGSETEEPRSGHGRALTAQASADDLTRLRQVRALAPFLTMLVAASLNSQSQRTRRRGDPELVSLLYRARYQLGAVEKPVLDRSS